MHAIRPRAPPIRFGHPSEEYGEGEGHPSEVTKCMSQLTDVDEMEIAHDAHGGTVRAEEGGGHTNGVTCVGRPGKGQEQPVQELYERRMECAAWG